MGHANSSQVNLALDIESRISDARLEIISLISANSSGFGYLACIETKVVKNAFCIFPKATPNAKSFSFCICSALFEGSKKDLYNIRDCNYYRVYILFQKPSHCCIYCHSVSSQCCYYNYTSSALQG